MPCIIREEACVCVSTYACVHVCVLVCVHVCSEVSAQEETPGKVKDRSPEELTCELSFRGWMGISRQWCQAKKMA